MNSRAAVSVALMFVIELVIGATVFFLLNTAAIQWGNGEQIRKSVVAEDLALLISELETSNTDTIITYPRDVSEYTIRVKGSCVEVGEGLQDQNLGKYCFTPSGKVDETQLIKPKELYIISDSFGISIQDKKKEFLGRACPEWKAKGTVAILPEFAGLANDQIMLLNRARIAFETSLGDSAVSRMQNPNDLESTNTLVRFSDHVIRLKVSSRLEGVEIEAPEKEMGLGCATSREVSGTLTVGEFFRIELPRLSSENAVSLGSALGTGVRDALS